MSGRKCGVVMSEEADATVCGVAKLSMRKNWDEVFKSKNLLKIAQNLGNDWKKLATCLGFERPQIENFEADSRILSDVALNMLTSYRDGSRLYGSTAQIEEFVEALQDAGRHDLAAKVSGESAKQDQSGGRPSVRKVVAQQPGDHKEAQSSSSSRYSNDKTNKVEPCTDAFYKKKHLLQEVYPVVEQAVRVRGLALIINILKDRKGAEKDGALMTDLFTQLGYRCKTAQDQTKEEITAMLKKVAKDEVDDKHDSIVIFLMAHGQIGQIFDVDNYALHYHDLFEIFNNTRCPKMKGKPKLFFFQACRGVQSMPCNQDDRVLQPAAREETDAVPVEQSVVSRASDVLVAHATVPGNEAYRSTDAGSRYPRAIWDVFRKDAKDTHVADLLTRVNRHMHDAVQYKERYDSKTKKAVPMTFHQCAETTSTLRKEFYFFPRQLAAGKK